MRSIWLVLWICACSPFNFNGLSTKDNQIEWVQGDSVYQFSVTDKDIALQKDLSYTFFYKNEIFSAQGIFMGKLLDGPFTLTSRDRRLITQGRFVKGVKDGEWKTWHSNGRLESLETWRKGYRHGAFVRYDLKGDLVFSSGYKDGLMHGEAKYFEHDSLAKVERYEKGRLVVLEIDDSKRKKDEAISEPDTTSRKNSRRSIFFKKS